MIDLAVAVVIGTAFGAVVNSLVKDVLMPILSYVVPSQDSYQTWHFGKVAIGKFLSEIVNFAVIALAVFIMIVKLLGAIMKKAAPPPAPSEPVTKECPLCLSVIPMKARKCGHCTADLPQPA
jgi:large conductance mechanosensitive channel